MKNTIIQQIIFGIATRVGHRQGKMRVRGYEQREEYKVYIPYCLMNVSGL